MKTWWHFFWIDTEVFVKTLFYFPLILLLVAFVIFVVFNLWKAAKELK